MNKDYTHIIELLQRYYAGLLTDPKACETLFDLLNKNPQFKNLLNQSLDENFKNRYLLENKIQKNKALQKFDAYINYHPHNKFKWLRYAASIILPLAIGIALCIQFHANTSNTPTISNIPAEKYLATLKLADGQTMPLKYQVKSTVISNIKDTKVTNKAGVLSYLDTNQRCAEIQYNTLEVPRSGMFRVILADGSKVYLNAETKLKYPVTFGEKNRKVFLDGEAYFEIAKDSTRPFIVQAKEISVRVYGTTFNINTHIRNQIQTTLIEGSISITLPATDKEIMLRPNMMAKYSCQTKDVTVSLVNTRLYTAWKYGEFVFENATLESIMEQLSRWYNVNVFYECEATKHLIFNGIADRFDNIRDVLALLESTQTVKFNLKGNTITVKKSFIKR
ncbi:MAG: FecR family protein [Odoribacter splanchnicus]